VLSRRPITRQIQLQTHFWVQLRNFLAGWVAAYVTIQYQYCKVIVVKMVFVSILGGEILQGQLSPIPGGYVPEHQSILEHYNHKYNKK